MSKQQPYQPCHECGTGQYIYGSRSFSVHFSLCDKHLLKSTGDPPISDPNINHPSNNNICPEVKTYSPTIYNLEVDTLGNPVSQRSVLEAHVDNSFQPFVFEDNNDQRWELNNDHPPILGDPPASTHDDMSSLKQPFQKCDIIDDKTKYLYLTYY